MILRSEGSLIRNWALILTKYVEQLCQSSKGTDCPATFSTLCAGYCSAVGRHSGLFWVYSGRGRFGVFSEVLWTQVG